jgi:hypothetical protein
MLIKLDKALDNFQIYVLYNITIAESKLSFSANGKQHLVVKGFFIFC